MGLQQYTRKRDFTKTAEPASGKGPARGALRFVIQKHAASHLHYDFRLEMQGVLKSWAVPKGPSTDPKVKRLAMMVEDHPFDYRDFEGSIPKGQYGGGTVIVWDEGTYQPIEPLKGKKAQEKHLLAQLEAGSLKIVLHGEKLQGEFALVKTHGMAENSWLLMKHKDKFASRADITRKEKSVKSGKTLDEVAKIRDALPLGMKPMLATLVDEPFDDPDWIYEVKWDGYRALAAVENGKAELWSRTNKPFNDRFYPIFQLLQMWTCNAVFDGEIVVLNNRGISDFGALQNWRSEADGELVYYVFDLLWYNGRSTLDLPLEKRQALLAEVLPVDDERVRLSKVFEAGGKAFFKAAERTGLEGIMAKKRDSIYLPDARSKEWLKVKIQKHQEVVIGGYTRNAETSKQFSALLLGVFESGKFRYVGKVGTGFSDALQKEMLIAFHPHEVHKSPFDVVPDYNKSSRFRPHPPKASVTWLKPELVGEITFTEITEDGVFRHPAFKGMRPDKPAREVVRESAAETKELLSEVSAHDGDALVDAPKSTGRKTLLNPKDETQVRTICGHALKFTHLSKLYWPEDGISKRDMFNYYYQIGEFILPYLKDRPQSLNRFPNGIHGKAFYQKNVKDKAPEWAKTFPYSTGDGEEKEFLVATDEASLLWMASLGCIEMNPWFSRVSSPDQPDWCIIDLDPDKQTFDQVIQTALVVKEVLDSLGVPSWCKTSGSTGMHIYIPMGARYTYEQSQLFARLIVNAVHSQLPAFTTLERSIKNRGGKMYLDFLQNRPGATIAGPYSLRPKPGATVSMPLLWEEVKKGLTMKQFTIRTAPDRLKETGDLFSGTLAEGIDLEKAIRKAKLAL